MPDQSTSQIHLEPKKMTKAVQALRQLCEKLQKDNKLVDEVQTVEMQVCLKKIPSKAKTVKLRLPHSIAREDTEVCLFVKDLDKTDRDYEPTVRHYKDLFRLGGVKNVSDIIPLKSVKTEYKAYESKRNLSKAYDVFLADVRIIRLLPSYLGKFFYGEKKNPVQVNLNAKDLAKEISTAIGNSRCILSLKGSMSTAVVGHIEMTDDEIGENVAASAAQLSEGIPGGPDNIKLMNIKLKNSTSIPIYIGRGGPQDIKLPKKEEEEEVEAEDVSTVFGAKVKVYASGHIELVKENEDGSVGNDNEKGKMKRKLSKTGNLKGPAKSKKLQADRLKKQSVADKKKRTKASTKKQPVKNEEKRPTEIEGKQLSSKKRKRAVENEEKQPATKKRKQIVEEKVVVKKTKQPFEKKAKMSKSKKAKSK